MFRSTLAILVAVRVAAFLCVCLSVDAAQAQDPATPSTYAIGQPPEGLITEEIIRKARPLDIPQMPREELDRLRSKERRTLDLPKADLQIFGTPSDANVGTFPYNNAGKLLVWFPETPNDQPQSCTAQFVGAPSVILTAAHCIQHETGVWARYYVFFQGYNRGAMIQRVELGCPGVMTGWKTPTGDRWKWDYAFIKTRSNSTTGHFGLSATMPSPSLEAIGYPENFGATERMQAVAGSRGTVIENLVRMDGNPFGRGASGGAWHVNGYVMGNNSRVLEGMWSPLYDNNTVVLWRFVDNNCH